MKVLHAKEVLKSSTFLETYDPSELVQSVETLLSERTPRDEIVDALDDIRQGLDEDSEEIVLDVMDRLVGFCAPNKRL